MKRVILILTLATLFLCPRLAAQESEDTAPMWGVRAAFDMNIPGDWHINGSNVKMYNHGYGGTLGTVCNYISAEVFISNPAYRCSTTAIRTATLV